MSHFHFLRPWWLLALLPLLGFLLKLIKTKRSSAWDGVCDAHLLPKILQQESGGSRQLVLWFLGAAGVWMCLSLAGPSWHRLPVPSYHSILPRVLVLSMSEAMLERDLSPNRLTRAKFVLHDLLRRGSPGQLGLVVFTEQPFVVSPLTEDGNTIDALLEFLSPQIMPLGGDQLAPALAQAAELINSAGFPNGQILVLTASSPDASALNEAARLQAKGIDTSVMPMVNDASRNPLFLPLVEAGHGRLLTLEDSPANLEQWLSRGNTAQTLARNTLEDIPEWRDEGPWFLIPALLFFLPVFWRGWLQRIAV